MKQSNSRTIRAHRTTRSVRHLVTAAAWSVAIATPVCADVSLTDFSDTTGLSLNGSAATTTTADGTVLRVAPAGIGNAGSTFSNATFDARYGFSTSFALRISDMDAIFNGADGMTFTLQSSAPGALGDSGGFLGYGGSTAIAPSVAVRFDIFQNDPYEASDNFVGLLANGQLNDGMAHPQQASLTGNPNVSLRDGNLVYTWIDYDGGNLNLYMSETNTKPATPVFTGLVSASQLANAYAGFTAATGSGYANFDVVNWSFASTGSAFTDIHSAADTLVATPGQVGNWNDVATWQENQVPTVQNNVFLGAPSTDGAQYAVEVTDHQQSQNLDLSAATGGKTALYVHAGASPATLDVAGDLTLRPDTAIIVADTSAMNVAGTTHWTGGNIGGDFNGDIATGTINFYGPLLIGGAGNDLHYAATTLNLYGATTWLGNNIVTIEPPEGGTINNYNVFDIQTDGSFFWGVTQSPTINNQAGAVLQKTAGAGIMRLDPIVNNSGTVNANSGMFWLAGGGDSTGAFYVSPGATLAFSDYARNLSGSGAIQTTLENNSTVYSGGTVVFSHDFGSSTTDVYGRFDSQLTIVDAHDSGDADPSLGVVNFNNGAQINQGITGDLLVYSGALNIATGNTVNFGNVSVGASVADPAAPPRSTLSINSGTSVLIAGYLVAGDAQYSNAQLFIDGAGTFVQTQGDTYLGNLGHAFAVISSGAQLQTLSNGYVGAQSNGDAPGGGPYAVVTGTDGGAVPSSWSIGGDLFVGAANGASGQLDVSSGGLVSVGGAIHLGRDGASNGLINVFGPDVTTGMLSTLSSNGDLIVGESGNGLLHIFDGSHNGGGGGLVTTGGNACIGLNSDGSGTVTVEDIYAPTMTPSTWSIAGDLVVGSSGFGTLNIGVSPFDPSNSPHGGLVIVGGSMHVGAAAGSTGVVNVIGVNSSGARATLSVTGDMTVGEGSTGSLNIGSDDAGIVDSSLFGSGGGLVNVGGNMTIGQSAGLTGTVQVKFTDSATGLPSELNVAHTLTVGQDGTGNLGLWSGGKLTSGNAVLGASPTGWGVASLSYLSSWQVNGDLTVGQLGSGNLNIWWGSSLSTTGMVSIGATTDGISRGNGYLEINNGSFGATPIPSVLSVGTLLEVGGAADGQLNIGEHGEVSAQDVNVGSQPGGSGTLTLNGVGAKLTSAASIIVGNNGYGTLGVYNGAVATSNFGIIGSTSSATGQATVSGDSALWDMQNNGITIGGAGSGTLNILNGGTVKSGSAAIGYTRGSWGSATVSGQLMGVPARWQIGQNTGGGITIGVGDDAGGTITSGIGYGQLTIQAGGNVTSGAVTLGSTANGSGSLHVQDPGSLLDTSRQISVGADGQGSMTISNGAIVRSRKGTSVTNSAGLIGVEGAGVGTVVVDYATWANLDGSLSVGFGNNGVNSTSGGTGYLTVQNGGTVSSIDGYVARFTGSTGQVTITGTNSAWNVNGNFYVGGNESASSGVPLNPALMPRVSIVSGGSLNVSESAPGAGGVVKVWEHGTIDLVGPSSTLNARTVDIVGVLMGDGSVHAGVTNEGELHVGHSPGILNIVGDYTQTNAGLLTLTLNSTTPGTGYSQLFVTGNVNLDPGGARLGLVPGYTIQPNDTFDLIHYSGTLSGSFDTSTLPLNYQLSYNSGPDGHWLVMTAVPEPGSATVLLFVTQSLLLLRRRQRAK